jgi:hypothetical protein
MFSFGYAQRTPEKPMLTPCSGSDSPDNHLPPSGVQAEALELRSQVEQMQERERRLMQLLKASAPERIEHNLRNVLNELVLLRSLFDPKSGD